MSDPIRAALEQLVETIEGIELEGLPEVDEALAAARAALAAAPEGEGPTDEEWDALVDRVWDKYQTVGYQGERFMYNSDFGNALDLVRKELAHSVRPAPLPTPATGEVEELVVWLRAYSDCEFGPCSEDPDARSLYRAAALLEQQQERIAELEQRAESDLIPDIRYEFSVLDEDYAEQAGGSAPTYAQALDEGQRYLAQYQQDGVHTLELRRVEVLPIPQEES